MSKNSGATSGGLGLTGLCEVLGVVFIVLKLCKVIDWSWFWVLAPIWMPIALWLLLFIILIILKIIEIIVDRRRYR